MIQGSLAPSILSTDRHFIGWLSPLTWRNAHVTFDRRHLLRLSTVALATGWSFCSAATTQPSDEAAVAEAVERLRQAMIDADRAALVELLADQLSYGHSDGRVQTKAEFIDAIVNKRSVFHAITLSDQTLAIVGDGAIVRHRFAADAVSGGKPSSPRIAVLQVWQKQNGRWTLLVRQAH
jgi:ketosteroid isomerase-like protein